MPADWTYAGRRGFYTNREEGRVAGYFPTRTEVLERNQHSSPNVTDLTSYPDQPRLWFLEDGHERCFHCEFDSCDVEYLLCAECDVISDPNDYLCEGCRGNLS